MKNQLKVKQEVVSDLKKKFESSTVAVLVDYRGMSVKSVTELKKKLRTKGAELKVVKNTLTERALEKKEFENLKPLLEGPIAILLGAEDPIGPVKVLAKFISDNEKPLIKGGVFEGKITTSEEMTEISKLPSREELIATVVGRIKSPLVGLVFMLKGTINKLVYAVQAVKEKKEKEVK
jgi:large subunit ribosomal protein L10